MKRYLFALMLLFVGTMGTMAQSMSDDQIINYIIKEQQAGTPQTDIAKELARRGVTVEQLQRVQNKAERLKADEGLGTISNDPNTKKNNNRMRRNMEQTLSSEKVGATLTRSETQEGIKETLNEFMPDSMGIYEQSIIQKYLQKKAEHENASTKAIFGHNLFNNKNLTFEPAMNIATPSNYILGPGDAVFIDIYGASQETINETISPDGCVTIPGVGPIQLSGLTVSQANTRLRSQLGSRYSSSNIKLTLGQTRTITVNIMGEVKTPGSYTMSAFATVFHALYLAGGPNGIGTLRNIKVYRNNRLLSTVDVYDYILNGKLSGNIRLADNDVISVGTYDCLVNIEGKVKRPMFYEMKQNESMRTLLSYAGGFTGDAYKKNVRVIRKSNSSYSVYNVGEFEMASFHMADGDSVTVDSIVARYANMVELKGAVFHPGKYQLGGNIHSVKTLLEQADGITEDAFTAHAVMHRMQPNRVKEVIQVDIEGIMNGTVADIPLKNEDVLFVPMRQDKSVQRTIEIFGEVQFPGKYVYADNETLEDFVLQAGGLKESASTASIFVSRRVVDPSATKKDSLIGQSFNFTLKDGFIIDGDKSFVLQPFDNVFVRRSPGYYEQRNVHINGEVLYSGAYSLTKQNERLSDLVKKAGGVNSNAYIDGARLERRMNEAERMRYRESVKLQREQNERAMMELALKSGRSMSEVREGTRISTQEKLSIPETYLVGIDLAAALKNPGCDLDIVLREGDVLTIPQIASTVKISGEVMYPNTVSYEKGRSLSYYINQAGGYGTNAKKSKTYVIYMNGDVTKASSGTKILPGCEIVVPMKIRNRMTTTETVALGTGVASIATMIATLVNIMK